MQAIDEVLVAKMHADLRQAVPFVFDYFDDPEDDPFAEDRWNIIPTQQGWLVCDHHTNDHHEVLRTQLLHPNFDFIMFLYNEKCKIEDELCTENHPVRVRKRQEQQEALDKYCAKLPPMIPLSRLESPVPPDWMDESFHRHDLPHTFRMFMLQMGRVPDIPGAAEDLIQSLEQDFWNFVPYSFDPAPIIDHPITYDEHRFMLEYSEREFLLLTDTYHNRGYELPYSTILWERWDPRTFLEREHAELTAAFEHAATQAAERHNRNELLMTDTEIDTDMEEWTEEKSDTETSWSNCGFTSSGDDTPPSPPPPPPASGAAAIALDGCDSDSEFDSDGDQIPHLQDVSDTESEFDVDDESGSWSDYDSEGDRIPDLQDVPESESGSDDESDGSHGDGPCDNGFCLDWQHRYAPMQKPGMTTLGCTPYKFARQHLQNLVNRVNKGE
ncbi:hypothetical protein B0H17DRAFT_1277633 [Mycena rosella]|uniref:Uncharacterized protein n=1 Tax=Mycena rosella TaxID=1033263 RepID=A0AAD7FS91_MYCRO|nr:hypothetical protein B0H17DRAFT_1277633 [Mycena rosella]